MRVPRFLVAIGFIAVFAAGWLGGARNGARAPVVSTETAAPVPPTGASSSCVDEAAMEANANLVAQLQEWKAKLRAADERAKAAAAQVEAVENAGPSLLVVAKDEWSRMGKEGTLRVRTPCTSWEGPGRSQLIQRNGRLRTVYRAGGSAGAARALVAGLSLEEAREIDQVYKRVQRRAWTKIERACHRSESYREWTTEHPPETDAERIEYCRLFVLAEPSQRRATVQRVAELRAARLSIDRAESDPDRVLFATSELSEDLWNELAATLGREKARRAAEGGALCVDETVYDVRERDAERDPS